MTKSKAPKNRKPTRPEYVRKTALVRIWAKLTHDERKAFLARLDENLVFHPKEAQK